MAYKFFDGKMWFYDFIKWTGAIPVALDLRPKKLYETSKEKSALNKGSYIISCNHMSFIDPIIISAAFWFRRLYFIATKDLFQTKFWNFVFSHVNCIPIDKNDTSMKTFLSVKEKIDEGRPVCVFPEGSVQKEELGKLKSGIVMMALIANAEIVPIYIGQRKKVFFHRQRIIIGDRINIKSYCQGNIPTMQEIEAITKLLSDKELKLERMFKEDTNDL